MNTCIALFRGINVGGKNVLPKKQLVAILEALGAQSVQTYIQSGNAVFQSMDRDCARFAASLTSAIQQGLGFESQALVFGRDTLAEAIGDNPYPDLESGAGSLHFGFLFATPPSPDLRKLDSLRSPTERFHLAERVFYLHAPDGVGRSRLAASAERLLGVPMTDRNGRTVAKIMAMAMAMNGNGDGRWGMTPARPKAEGRRGPRTPIALPAMSRSWARTAAALLCATAGVALAEQPMSPTPPKAPLALLLVGDSTMATGTGYGDALCQRVAAGAACLNLARGGRSSKSYRAEGLWVQALAQLAAFPAGTATYVLIQFGHNDQPGRPGRSTDLNREYPANLATFVAEVRAAGGKPVLVTPLARRSFTRTGALIDDLRPWALAMRQVAHRHQVPLVDLYGRSATAVQAMGPALSKQMAVAHEAKPGFDTTHLGAKGACVFSDMVWHGLVAQAPVWAAQAGPAPDCGQVPAP